MASRLGTTVDVVPYKIVPLWKPKPAGSYYFNVQKAVNAGLVNRPMVEMITDQLNGYKSRYPKDDIRFGEVINGKQLKYYSASKEKQTNQVIPTYFFICMINISKHFVQKKAGSSLLHPFLI